MTNSVAWTKISKRGWNMACWTGRRIDGVTFRLDKMTRNHGADISITLIDERVGHLPRQFATLAEARTAAEMA